MLAAVGSTIRGALDTRGHPGVPVEAGRLRHPVSPAVLYRHAGTKWANTLDLGTVLSETYEIQCRAPTADGARRMAADILHAFGDRVLSIDESDDESDASSLRGGYFAHTLMVELAT